MGSECDGETRETRRLFGLAEGNRKFRAMIPIYACWLHEKIG